MQKPSVLFLVLSLFFCAPIKAHEFFFSLSEEIQTFYLSPPNSSGLFSRTELQLKGQLDFLENLKFKLDSSVSYTALSKQDQNGFLFNPNQLGILSSSSVDFFVGGFTITGDGADINNIFNVVNPQDYRQPFNSKSIGSYGALLTVPAGNFTFKAFYIPQNQKSLLPDTQSPWWPRTKTLPIRNSNSTFYIPDNMTYSIGAESEEKTPFKDNFGFSAKQSFEFIDLSAFYFSGVNQTPRFYPKFDVDLTSIEPPVGTLRPQMRINLTWYRSEHLGGGATVLLKDWIFKVYCKQQKDFLPVVEKTSSCTGSIENSLAVSRFSLRYFLQINRLWKESTNLTELETLLGFFEKSTAIGTYFDMESKGLISGAVIYNEKDPSTLVSLGYEYRFSDQFRMKLTGNVLTSSGNALADAYDKIDNIVLLTTYDF